MNRRIHSSDKLISGIDVSGFVAIMLFLVCLFMVPAGMHDRDLPARVTVDLPKVANPKLVPGARREDAIMVSVTRSGDIFFGYDRIPSDNLHERVRKAIKGGSENTVYVNADARTKYKTVKNVLDELRFAGVQGVVFMVDERRKP